ncbi:MAG: PLxRFG domain-containing protein [Rhodobacteraceae bacterium]|nr:MAG: PLxRFG domain-containing protein [Paracoccaceae bacterium]
MANSVPGASPLQNALAQLGQLPAQDRMALAKQSFDGIARETKIPANVLIAMDEAAGGGGDANRARQNAMKLSETLRAGGTIEDAIFSMSGGPGAGQAILDRSYAIADALYPASQPQQVPQEKQGPGLATDIADTAKAFATGAIRGVGSMARGAGVAGDEMLRNFIQSYGTRDEDAASSDPVVGETFMRPAGRAAEAAINSIGENVSASISDRGQEAMRGTEMGGELFKPSTWTLGEDPSLRGLILQSAQGVGSMAPMLVARHPVVAATMGSLMSGGEGAANGRKFVEDAATTMGDDGRPVIEQFSGYKELLSDGATPEQATQELARRAENDAGFFQAIIGSLGGAATNRIFRSADGWLGAGGRLTSAAKKSAVGFIEEGSQEALEGAASQGGIQRATGQDMNLAEDSFGNFVLGGLSGGISGGAGGMIFGATEEQSSGSSDPETPDIPLMLPAPPDEEAPIQNSQPLALPAPMGMERALPAPENGGTIFGSGRGGYAPDEFEIQNDRPRGPTEFAQQPAQMRADQNTIAVGSRDGAVAAPDRGLSLPAPTGAAATNDVGVRQPSPAGPIEAIAQSVQMPTPAPEAPVRFPDQKPGAAIRLGDPESGQIFDAVFLGETETGAKVRISGQEVDLTPQEFDMGRNSVVQIEAAQKEIQKNVEPASAGDETIAPETAGTIRLSDAVDPRRQRAAQGGTDLGQGIQSVQGLPEQQQNQTEPETGTSDLGGMDVADDAGQFRDQLNDRPERVTDTSSASEDQLRRRLAFIESQGRTNGWNGRISKERDRIAKALADMESQSITDPSPEVISDTDIADAAAQANPEPTEAQKEAGNYRMGHTTWNGMDLTFENAKGSERRGVDADGEAWSVTMPAHYGYFKGTKGADGDHVDFYMGDDPNSDTAYVVDQFDATSGEFDEHKVMLGFTNLETARDVYDAGFSDGRGPDRRGSITEMDATALQSWLSNGKKSGPLGAAKDLTTVARRQDQTGDQTAPKVKPERQEAEAEASSPSMDEGTTSKSDKIEDFGEKIGGARKDLWSNYANKIAEAGNLDTEAVPLSKSWPAPDYLNLIESGVERWKVDFIRVARDSIPNKPSRKHRVRGWATRVELLREFTEKVLDGTYKRSDIDRVLGQPETDRDMSALRGAMELYEAVGHEKSLKGMKFSAANYSVYQGQTYNPPKVFWEVTQSSKASAFSNMPSVIARGNSKEEALESFKKAYDGLETSQRKADARRKFLIYSHNNGAYFTIGTKIGSTYVELRRVDTVEDARRVRDSEADQLTEQFEKMRQIPADRRPENMPRMGVDHRSGVDITPQQFSEAFGFRGVEFGNWVEGSRRQQDLNDAYDALMDLSGLLDLPPRAISLNGTLGLAFGARGRGGVSPAAAHYESDNVVINLTKKQGAGSLAHEWFHAIDNHFGKMREDRRASGYISDNASPGRTVEGIRDEVVDAFVTLRHAIGKTDLKKRSSNIDKMRSSPYWGTGIEMHARAFESYVIAKLADQNLANDYLANIVNGAAWGMQAELSGLGDSYPYLTESEIEVVRPAFDQLFDTISTRESERGIELYQRDMGRDRIPVAELRGDELGEWSDIKDLGKKATDWYRANLISKDVTMSETGWVVKFSRRGSNKIGGRKGDDLLRIVPALQQIIENGHLVSSEENRKEGGTKAYHKIAARVLLDGVEKDVIATIRESHDGHFHYDLSRDITEGSKFSRPSSPVSEAGARDERTGLNILDQVEEINGISTASLSDLASTVSDIIAAHGLRTKVSSKVMKQILTKSGVPVLGSYRNGKIKISSIAADPAHVAHHEIIHALRDQNLWGKPYGLFTQTEWQALVRAARGNTAIRDAVETAYSDLSTAAKSEEMVAEFYADWARSGNTAQSGALGRALERMLSFFRAVSSALRGTGFIDTAQVMRDIAYGNIGRRGPNGAPEGGGRGEERTMLNTTTKEFKAWFGDSKVVDENGKPLVVYHGTYADVTDAEFAFEFGHDFGWDPIGSNAFFFSEPGDMAKSYQEGGREVAEVYLQSKNPLDLTSPEGISLLNEAIEAEDKYLRGEAYGLYLSKPVLLEGNLWEQILEQEPDAPNDVMNGLISWAKSEGFDAIKMLDAGRGSEGVAWAVFDPTQIKSIYNRGTFDPDDDRIMYQRDLSAFKEKLMTSKGKSLGMIGDLHWKRTPKVFSEWMSNKMTDAMGANDRFNILGTVPGYALFSELGKNLPGAQKYLGLKQEMDAERNRWQAITSEVVDKWTETGRKNPKANDVLMDLMHRTTLAGIDPSKSPDWSAPEYAEADRVTSKDSAARQRWAQMIKDVRATKQADYDKLKAEFDAMPVEFRKLYSEVRDKYSELADQMDAALMENIRAASKIAVKRADREHRKELDRIRDEGLTGKDRRDALEAANDTLAKAHARSARGSTARLKQLRQIFESNRLQGPYFPLARFGNYFVAIRNAEGKMVSFSRFENAADQENWIKEAKDKNLGEITRGVITNPTEVRGAVDPTFLADVEGILDEAGASQEMMDAVWQRFLETLPDQSIRTNRIHRKGRAGFNKDAVRAFASAMFHGAHQNARLRYGMEMEEALNEAEEQAARQDNPERTGFVVREMKQRHAFTMAPTNNPWVTKATSLAFVWYLGVSPAAALVNVSQTSVVGIPIMAARFRKNSGSASAATARSIKALTRASKDFMAGKGETWKDQWSIENAPNLTDEERAAMHEAYRRGVIDKTQAHDLASVAESGVEYNPTREKVMRIIGWGFHHAERFNREVTFLANYRLLRAEGMSHTNAISEADMLVKKIHFDYQNTSKPRAMQGDAAKIVTIFRNFTVNMLFRLFRDTHQSLFGADEETRREAKAQLIGVSLSMMAHAGIRGVWGYGLIMSLMALFFPGTGDDMDEWLQDALLMEGDDMGTAAWNWTMGMVLNGAPGHALGIDLTSRIGMPNLWFRPSQRDLEGEDLWAHMMEELAGPIFGIPAGILTGMSQMSDGQYLRGAEKMVPTFGRNVIKTTRYATEGVTTYNGDDLVDGLNPWQFLMQATGFTPAEVAERYEINTRLKNQESRISNRRSGIMRDIGDAVRAGEEIPQDALERLRKFNLDYPEWAITSSSLRQSMQSRARASQRNEFGVSLNPKINDRIRSERAPAIYG